MGFLQTLETRASKGGQVFLDNADRFALQLLGGSAGETASGIHVTENRALEWSSLAAAVRILCNTTAMVPLQVLQREDRGKIRRDDMRLYRILHDSPNPEQTAFEFRALIPVHMILWGNFYAQVIRTNGEVREIWPLNPDRVTAQRRGRALLFVVQTDDGPRTLERGEVLHIPGFSSGGLIGRSMAKDHAEAIGLGLATERYTARFFGNDATPGGYLKHPEEMSDEAYARLKMSWEAAHRGLDHSHRMAILEEGTEWVQVMSDPEKADALGLKKFQVNEAIRIVTGVPPHLIGDWERATFSNVEEASRNFVQYGAQPNATRMEQRMNLTLLTEGERDAGLFIEHQLQGLLRGSTEARRGFYESMLDRGVMSINDVRSFENLNAIELGDEHFIRMDMQTLDRAINAPPPEPPMRTRELTELIALQQRYRRPVEVRISREDVTGSFEAPFTDAMRRITARELAKVRGALGMLDGGDEAGFREFLRSYYFETLPPQIREIVGALFVTYAEQVARAAGGEIEGDPDIDAAREFAGNYTDGFGNRHSAESRRQIEAKLEEPGDSADMVRGLLDRWEEDGDSRPRHVQMAGQEVRQLGQGVARAVFVAAGAAFLVSRAVGDSCPYCVALDGKRVGAREPFLREGEVFQPEGADVPLQPASNRFAPPYHDGCNCRVEPG